MAANNNPKGAETKDLLSQDLVEAVVAKRRTVRGQDGKSHGPGATVSLPAAEVDRLRKAGFLETPGASPVSEGNGPSFTPQGAPAPQTE